MTRIALFQSRTGIDPARSADALREAVADAAKGGAQILFTPEMVNVLDRDRTRAGASIVEEGDDPTVAAARSEARAHGVWVHLGSVAVAAGDGKRANRPLLIDPGGTIVARYDKMHLFDVDVGPGDRWRESDVYRAGERPVMATGTPVGAMGWR